MRAYSSMPLLEFLDLARQQCEANREQDVIDKIDELREAVQYAIDHGYEE